MAISETRVVGIPDVITYANYGDDWLKGLRVVGGQILLFPTIFRRRPQTTLALQCKYVIHLRVIILTFTV